MLEHHSYSSCTSLLRAVLLILGGLGAGACGSQATGGDTGSETHWLSACEVDADCGVGSCLCNVCTTACDGPSDCAAWDDGQGKAAVCAVSWCDDSPGAAAGLCTEGCKKDGDCPNHLSCDAGVCLPERLCDAGTSCEGEELRPGESDDAAAPPSSQDAGSVDAGSADVSAESCAAADVAPANLPCNSLLGWYWDGDDCMPLALCDCIGDDCDNYYASRYECRTARVSPYLRTEDSCAAPELLCTGLSVAPQSDCENPDGYAWTGSDCEAICDCVGGDCDWLAPSREACVFSWEGCLTKLPECSTTAPRAPWFVLAVGTVEQLSGFTGVTTTYFNSTETGFVAQARDFGITFDVSADAPPLPFTEGAEMVLEIRASAGDDGDPDVTTLRLGGTRPGSTELLIAWNTWTVNGFLQASPVPECDFPRDELSDPDETLWSHRLGLTGTVEGTLPFSISTGAPATTPDDEYHLNWSSPTSTMPRDWPDYLGERSIRSPGLKESSTLEVVVGRACADFDPADCPDRCMTIEGAPVDEDNLCLLPTEPLGCVSVCSDDTATTVATSPDGKSFWFSTTCFPEDYTEVPSSDFDGLPACP